MGVCVSDHMNTETLSRFKRYRLGYKTRRFMEIYTSQKIIKRNERSFTHAHTHINDSDWMRDDEIMALGILVLYFIALCQQRYRHHCRRRCRRCCRHHHRRCHFFNTAWEPNTEWIITATCCQYHISKYSRISTFVIELCEMCHWKKSMIISSLAMIQWFIHGF